MTEGGLTKMNTDKEYPGIPAAMSTKLFARFSSFIHREFGIKMGPAKRIMLQSRLTRRLRALKFHSYEQYYDYLFSPAGLTDELPLFIHQVTTNKTDFFREPAHYAYLVEQCLPTLEQELGCGKKRNTLQVWSSACSTGEEPYTLAMVLADYGRIRPDFDFNILGTDISPDVLSTAIRGIYEEDRVVSVPEMMKTRYLLRSRNRKKNLIRIDSDLRRKVRFQWVNLKSSLKAVSAPVDIIFCRNVIIYFDRPTQQLVLENLCERLKPGGYMFMGHSETLGGLALPLRSAALTIYRKTGMD